MWPYPVRELEAYTSVAVRHTVHERVGGGYHAYWARPEAQTWQEEEDEAWTALNRITGDLLTKDGGVLTSLVWAAAWHATNSKYYCEGDAHGDWREFCKHAEALSTALAAPDLSYNIQWLIWNCAWVEVHNCKHGYTICHWNDGHHAGRGFGIAAVVAGFLAAPFTFGLSISAAAAGAAGLSALPPESPQAISGRETDYQGDLGRMLEHRENLERRQAGLADVYRCTRIQDVRQLRMLVYKKVQSINIAREILSFLWERPSLGATQPFASQALVR